jgi:hypothetical protein
MFIINNPYMNCLLCSKKKKKKKNAHTLDACKQAYPTCDTTNEVVLNYALWHDDSIYTHNYF